MKVIDPVCQVEIEKEDTKFISEYKGSIYYFDSPQCQKEFEDNPVQWLEINLGKSYNEHGDRLDGSE